MEPKIVILFFGLLFVRDIVLSKKASLRIVGGREATPHEFPYLVAITNANTTENNCEGAILNEKWILTAGHCLFNYEIEDYDIYAGKHDLTVNEDGQQMLHAKKFFIHPNFSPYEVGPNDIGLIYLNESIKFSKTIKPVKLPEKNSIPIGPAIISGWGSISYFLSLDYPPKLQTAIVQILKHEECAKHLHEISYDKSNLCTGPLGGKVGHCTGDSGSPLIQIKNKEHIAVGVASFAYVPCGDDRYPPAFGRISYFLDWIQKTMQSV